MKARILALAALFTIAATAAHAKCKTEACRNAVAWKNGYTAIVLDDDISSTDYAAVLEAVKANGGAVGLESERALLGWLPRAAAARLRARRGVRAVLFDPVPRPADLVANEEARYALGFFNRVLSGEYEDRIEAGLAIQGQPLQGCVVGRGPAASLAAGSEGKGAIASASLLRDVPAAAHRGGEKAADTRLAEPGAGPDYWYHTPYQNPDMRGRVTVQLFRLDSNGAIDPNLYTWSNADFAFARDQVAGAFSFWANAAYARNITLSFRVLICDPLSRYTRQIVPTPTKYEPITHGYADDYLWVNDALWYFGYDSPSPTPDSVYSANEQFNASKKNDPYYGSYDRSFSVYVIYNPPPAPSVFADGYRAYAMSDGPLVMLMWNSAGWGPDNLGRVLTHETGHIFWACDEYYDQPSNTGCFSCNHCFYNVGPRNQLATPWITNGNCNYPTTGCDVSVSCMMKDLYAGLCSRTPAQIGW